jgi:hypothetical protein
VHYALAPSFPTLQEGTAEKKLDDYLDKLMTPTHTLMGKTPAKDRTWDEIIAAISFNGLIVPHPDPIIKRTDTLMEEAIGSLNTDGSATSLVVEKVSLPDISCPKHKFADLNRFVLGSISSS